MMRRLAAIVLGPLVALQLLFAGVVSVQMAAQPPLDRSVICYGAGIASDDDRGGDGDHVRHAACAVCVFATLAPLMASGNAHLLLRDAYSCPPLGIPPPLVAVTPPHNPRSSQGPPPGA